MSELLTTKDVASLLRCTPKHIYELRKSKQIPKPLRVGRAIRWDPRVLERWIAEGCPATQEETA